MKRFPPSQAALLALLLCGCATAPEESYESRRRHSARAVSGEFEWAVQNYEAGNYSESLRRLGKLRDRGTEIPEYDLVVFYTGMAQFKQKRHAEAAKELEAFLRSSAGRQEAQDARVALLLCYEQLSRWKDAASLAAETDKLTLFHYNRALLKLVWARALMEQGELKGSRTVLEDSIGYLDKAGTDDRAIPYYSDPNRDLWGRYHFTTALLHSTECNTAKPKEFREPKKRTRRLYNAWLEATTDCLRQAFVEANQNLFSRESAWAEEGEKVLGAAMSSYGQTVAGYLKGEASSLSHYKALQKIAREQLYRLVGTLDEYLKFIKKRDLRSQILEEERKRLDHLLIAISGPP